MEFIPLGDLETNVEVHSGRLPEFEAKEITEQMLSGLEIMHAESFAHRDLKPQNILVDHGPPQWWIKIADFGLSKRLTESTSHTQGAGSLVYMAPEMLGHVNTNPSHTNTVDIWAVGCILYRLLAGCVPFPLGPALGVFCRDTSILSYEALPDSGIPRDCSGLIKQPPGPTLTTSLSRATSSPSIVLVTLCASILALFCILLIIMNSTREITAINAATAARTLIPALAPVDRP